MINFEEATTIAVDALSETDEVRELSHAEKDALNYEKNILCLEIKTEIMNIKGDGEGIIFHMKFPIHFPLFIPKIILPKAEFSKYRFLPHVEKDGGICTFDPETTRTDPLNPVGIVKLCVKKAKSIIESGITKINWTDYEDEFKNYWDLAYDENHPVYNDILCLIDGEPDIKKLELIRLSEKTNNYNFILHDQQSYALRFIENLSNLSVNFEYLKCIYIGVIKIDFIPPFNFDNEKIVKIINTLSDETQKKFRRFINSEGDFKHVCASVITNGKPQIILWMHEHLSTPSTINGFRKGKLSKYQMLTSFRSKLTVVRFSPTFYSPMQKIMRSQAYEDKTTNLKLLVAGLGSIGSNLIFFLNSFNEVQFTLVDPDTLTIGNLGRHFLGYDYVGQDKVAAMRKYMTQKNPFQKIEIRTNSIINILVEELDLANSCDYIFLLTGKTNIESEVTQWQEEGTISKPIFLVWVEPYLSAGHCVYLHTGSKNYKDFFDKTGLFKYNVIRKEEYLNNNPLLMIKEAGCQSTFMPYAQSAITSFLAGIFPEIKKIFEGSIKVSQTISWIGNLKFLKDKGITTQPTYTEQHHGSIIKRYE